MSEIFKEGRKDGRNVAPETLCNLYGPAVYQWERKEAFSHVLRCSIWKLILIYTNIV